MNNSYLQVQKSLPLTGTLEVSGAKNAILVIMLSTLLTRGVSYFYNVPGLLDVFAIIELLQSVGARVVYDDEQHMLMIDTTDVDAWHISAHLMQKTRASILVLAPLLVRFSNAVVGLPGGDMIGKRPIDFHLKNLEKLGARITIEDNMVIAQKSQFVGTKLVLEYPSIGATENILMAAVSAVGRTTLINAAIEPEVLDLIEVLRKMGARIAIQAPATLIIDGVTEFKPVVHHVIPDRLEAGAVLIAGAMTAGDVYIPNIPAFMLDVVLLKLSEMGHTVSIGADGMGIRIQGNPYPLATSFKTGPFPSFATDLQAPMMASLTKAAGKSVIDETVFENRFHHIIPLIQMGANISVVHANRVIITGVDELQGHDVWPTDIRASCALVLAGLIANGITRVFEVHHWQRGFDLLENRLRSLGANISMQQELVKTEHAVAVAQLT